MLLGGRAAKKRPGFPLQSFCSHFDKLSDPQKGFSLQSFAQVIIPNNKFHLTELSRVRDASGNPFTKRSEVKDCSDSPTPQPLLRGYAQINQLLKKVILMNQYLCGPKTIVFIGCVMVRNPIDGF